MKHNQCYEDVSKNYLTLRRFQISDLLIRLVNIDDTWVHYFKPKIKKEIIG